MKQRLIDADEFAIEEPKLWDWSSIDGISSTAVLKQCIWDVQCAPTVKAIPVDWITKYLHELNKQAEEELDFIINELGGYDTCHMMEYAIGIEKMLEKWEKENELDKV